MTPDFGQIYDDECAFVWRTLRRLGVAESELPDAVHDVFDVLFRRWDQYDPERPLRSWLFGICRRVAAASRRKLRDQVPSASPPALANATSPENAAASRELLLALLERLDESQRDAFVLHDLEGFSGAEIAEMLGIPRGTVYSRIRLAREQLAEQVRRLRLRRAV